MNLLYLVHRLPYPPDRGDRIRSWHLLRFLAEYAEVDVACLAEESVSEEQRMALSRVARRVLIVPLDRRARWFHAARSLATGRSATEGLFYARQLARTVTDWLSVTRYDRAVAFCSSMGQYLDLPVLSKVSKFVDLVDVDSQKWFDYAAKAGGLKRLLFSLEGRRVRRLERELSCKAKSLLVVSQAEANLLCGFCPSAKVYAVSNGVDLDYFRSPTSKSARTRSLAFVGALDYRANIDGITWFCREVWPQVRRRYSDATLSLIGRNPLQPVRELTAIPGIELVGQVPDIRPFVAVATAAIAPLRIARGIQNKVLEAAAMAKPVISSSAALEGLDLVPGEHLLRADTVDEWLTAISKLFDDPTQRERLATAGQSFVEQHYAWSARLAPVADLLDLRRASSRPATDGAEGIAIAPQGHEFATVPS